MVLKKYGIIPDGIPDKFVAEGLLKILPERLNGENVLIPRASVARNVLIETLKKRGASVTEFKVYDTIRVKSEYCPVKDGDFVLFTSSSTAEFFFENQLSAKKNIIPCCIGDITAATVKKLFKGNCFVAENASIPALIECVKIAAGVTHKSRSKKGD